MIQLVLPITKSITPGLQKSKLVVWILLTLPALYWTLSYWRGDLFYGEYVHLTGDLATQLLIVTLSVSSLSLLFGKARWINWLRRNRRYFGVASFAYAFLHTGAYLQRQTLERILNDSLDLVFWTGWLAFLLMLILALTSNNFSVRKLTSKWKLLHRYVYLAAALTFVHWIFSAFNPSRGYMHLAVLLALISVRVWCFIFRHPSRHRQDKGVG